MRIESIVYIENWEQLLTEEAFAMYRQCMYKPAYEDYRDKIFAFADDKNTKGLICLRENRIIGILILTLTGNKSAELAGIAVCSSCQKQGIGSSLIQEAANRMQLCEITAETDQEAVGFYRKLGFKTAREIKEYADGRAVRYHCTLTI